MNPALWISKTGLDAQQTNISVTSNNLANASTVGYKKARAIFGSALSEHQPARWPLLGGHRTPSGLMLGAGPGGRHPEEPQPGQRPDHGQFPGPDDQWPRLLEIQLPDGSAARYTRNASSPLNDEGTMVTRATVTRCNRRSRSPRTPRASPWGGWPGLGPARGTASPRWWARSAPRTSSPHRPAAHGENLFLETQSSGAPFGDCRCGRAGVIKQGMLETSNVNVTEELVNLIQAQREAEMNSRSSQR